MPISSIESNPGCNLSRQLNYLDKKLRAILREVESIPSDREIDTCLLLQHEEQLSSLSTELTNVLHELLSLEEDDSAPLEQQSQLSQMLFDIHLKVQYLRLKREGALSPTSRSGVKLPKLSVPV